MQGMVGHGHAFFGHALGVDERDERRSQGRQTVELLLAAATRYVALWPDDRAPFATLARTRVANGRQVVVQRSRSCWDANLAALEGILPTVSPAQPRVTRTKLRQLHLTRELVVDSISHLPEF